LLYGQASASNLLEELIAFPRPLAGFKGVTSRHGREEKRGDIRKRMRR